MWKIRLGELVDNENEYRISSDVTLNQNSLAASTGCCTRNVCLIHLEDFHGISRNNRCVVTQMETLQQSLLKSDVRASQRN